MFRYLWTVLVLLFSYTTLFAHKEWVHQYLVYQAYRFLQLTFQKDFPELRSHLAMKKYNGVWGKPILMNHWENTPAISIGVWREDEQDAVYDWGGQDASSTHFWKPDEHENAFGLKYNGSIFTHSAELPNAWEKVRMFAFGMNARTMPTNPVKHWVDFIHVDGNYAREWLPVTDQQTESKMISYQSLLDLYKNGNYYHHGWRLKRFNRYDPEYRLVVPPQLNPPISFDPSLPINNQSMPLSSLQRKNYAYHILGRIAHLLGDMSVPVHIHAMIHPCDAGMGDSHEMYMGGRSGYLGDPSCNETQYNFPAAQYNAETALAQGGLLFTEVTQRV